MVWGNTFFPVNGSTSTERTEVIRSTSGRPLRNRRYLDVEASYIGTSVADLSNWENVVRAALSVPYQNLYLADDLGLPTAASLTNVDSISGVVITDGPHFPEPTTPEWVKVRTVRFSGYAEYVIRGTESALVSWTQAISIVGNGGPSRRWRVPVNEGFKPIRQQITPYSIIRVTQSGMAVGHLTYPPRPAPVWPAEYMVNETDGITQEVGKPLGKAFVENVTRWNYVFEHYEMQPVRLVTPAF